MAPVAGRERVERIEAEGGLLLDGRHEVSLRPPSIVLHPLTFLPQHSNGMTFIAQDASGAELVRRPMFSVGGGFVVDEADMDRSIAEVAAEDEGRGVVSLPTVLRFLRDNHSLVRREMFVCFDGAPYDPTPPEEPWDPGVRWVAKGPHDISRDRHDLFDRLLSLIHI